MLVYNRNEDTQVYPSIRVEAKGHFRRVDKAAWNTFK
jgi:hypothetical protein